jgi:NTE family protein
VTGRALVLGAGGNAAIAWEVGVLAGLLYAGIDVRTVDVVIWNVRGLGRWRPTH